jgi:hypothetical protein
VQLDLGRYKVTLAAGASIGLATSAGLNVNANFEQLRPPSVNLDAIHDDGPFELAASLFLGLQPILSLNVLGIVEVALPTLAWDHTTRCHFHSFPQYPAVNTHLWVGPKPLCHPGPFLLIRVNVMGAFGPSACCQNTYQPRCPIRRRRFKCTMQSSRERPAGPSKYSSRILTRKTKELDHEKLVTVFHGSSLGSSSAIFIYGDCGSTYSSFKSY